MKTLKANVILGKKQIVLASLVLILGAAVYLNWQFAAKNNELTVTSALLENEAPPTIITDELSEDIPFETAAPADGEDTAVLSENAEVELLSEDANTDIKLSDNVDVSADPETASVESETTKVKNLGDALLVSAGGSKMITGKSIVDENYFVSAKLARERAHDESIETISMVLNDTELTDEDKQAVSAKAVALSDVIEAENRIENLIKAKGFEECVVYITDVSANVVVKTSGLNQDSATQIKNIIVSEGKISGENVSITEIN